MVMVGGVAGRGAGRACGGGRERRGAGGRSRWLHGWAARTEAGKGYERILYRHGFNIYLIINTHITMNKAVTNIYYNIVHIFLLHIISTTVSQIQGTRI